MKVQIVKADNDAWYTLLELPHKVEVVDFNSLFYKIAPNQLNCGAYILKTDCINDEDYQMEEKFDTLKRVFASGAQRDSDSEKEDYIESISWIALQRYCKYMKTQESRYGRGNWKKGIPIEEYEKSLLRHVQKYLANKYDGANLEPDVDHLAAAFFNLQGLIHELEKLNNVN